MQIICHESPGPKAQGNLIIASKGVKKLSGWERTLLFRIVKVHFCKAVYHSAVETLWSWMTSPWTLLITVWPQAMLSIFGPLFPSLKEHIVVTQCSRALIFSCLLSSCMGGSVPVSIHTVPAFLRRCCTIGTLKQCLGIRRGWKADFALY